MDRRTTDRSQTVITVLAAILSSAALASCFLDQATAPGQDVASLEFAVTGDSVVLLGGELALNAELPTSGGTGPSRVYWASSDTAVVTVDSLGVVTGVAIGEATIEARVVAPDIPEVTRTVAVQVIYASIAVDAVDSLTGLGETVALVARGLDVNGVPDGVVPATFSCPQSSIVSVDSTGTVTALANGVAIVLGSYGAYTDTTSVKVRQVAKRLSFAVPRIDFPGLNQDTTVAVEVLDTRDSVIVAPTVSWASSDSGAVTVTSTGIIRAISNTAAYVIAASDTAVAQLPVAVEQGVEALLVYDGDNQTATVADLVATPPAVIALDDGGNPVGGVWVTFAVTSGGGSLTGDVQLTNAAGVARVGSWTLGTVVGSNSITANAEGRTTVIGATALPGAASVAQSLVTVSQDTIAKSEVAQLMLQARDQYGNPLTTGGSVVQFTATGGTSTGLVGATVDHGNGTYSATFSGETAGTATTIGATIDGMAVTSQLPTITVIVVPAELEITAGNNQTADAGAAVATAPAVVVRDGLGDPIAGAVVTFAVTQGGGVIVDSVKVTGVDGIATLGGWLLGTVAGPNRLTATTGGLATDIMATGAVGPASPAASLLSVSDDTVAAGAVSTLRLEVRDQYGNEHTTGGLNVVFSLSDGTSNGTIGAVSDNGDGSYTADFTGEISGSASDVGATMNGAAVTSPQPTITVIPGAPSVITPLVGDNQTSLVGGRVPIAPSVMLEDSFGNRVPGAIVDFTATAGGGSVSGSPVVSDTSGTATIAAWTLGTNPGTNNLTASTAGLQHVFNATATVPAVLDTVVLGNLLLGAEPYRVAVSDASNLAYVTNRSSDYVTVIDVPGDSALKTITVGGKPAGIAVHRTNDRVYVASEVSNVLSVIDGSSHSVIATVALGETPAGVAIDEDESLVFVALPASNRVAVINSSTNTVADTVAVGSNPQWLAFEPGNHRLYVSNVGDGTVTVIDTHGPTVKATLSVGSNPQGIAVDEGAKEAYVATRSAVVVFDKDNVDRILSLPAGDHQGIAVGARLFVANATTHELLILNSNAGSLVGSVAVGEGARGVAIHAGSNRVYVAGSVDNSVTVVRDNALETLITSVGGPRGVAVHSGSNRVYVANGTSDNVSVIDAASHSPVGAPISAGASPWGAAVNEVLDRLYVSNSGAGSVTVIDTDVDAVVGTVAVGNAPRGLAVNPITGRVYVANHGDNTVSVIEGASNVVVATVTVGTSPTGVVVDTITNRIYVSHEADDVRVIDGVTNGVVGSIGPLGGSPSGLAWNGVTQMLYVPNSDSPGAIWLLDAATSSVTGSTAVSGVPASVCTDALRDLLIVPTSTAIQYLNGTTGVTVYTMFVATDALGVALNQQTNKVFIADKKIAVNGIVILQN